MAPSRDGGTHSAIPDTPATRAGIAVMSTLDGYLARPPGTYTPARATGSSSRSTVTPFRSNGPSRAGRCWWNASITDAASETAARSSGSTVSSAAAISSAGTRSSSMPTPSKRSVYSLSAPSPRALTSSTIARTSATGPSPARFGRGRRPRRSGPLPRRSRRCNIGAAYPPRGRRLSSSIGDRR